VHRLLRHRVPGMDRRDRRRPRGEWTEFLGRLRRSGGVRHGHCGVPGQGRRARGRARASRLLHTLKEPVMIIAVDPYMLRQAALRYWKRAIELTLELDCNVMNSEFNGRPEAASRSEAQFWRSMEELLPIFEREGVQLRLEPHPDDFVEDGKTAVDMIRGINSPNVSFLYCAPHTFHQGGNMVEIMEYAGDLLTHLHLADSFDHTASSGLRYIVNPPGS